MLFGEWLLNWTCFSSSHRLLSSCFYFLRRLLFFSLVNHFRHWLRNGIFNRLIALNNPIESMYPQVFLVRTCREELYRVYFMLEPDYYMEFVPPFIEKDSFVFLLLLLWVWVFDDFSYRCIRIIHSLNISGSPQHGLYIDLLLHTLYRHGSGEMIQVNHLFWNVFTKHIFLILLLFHNTSYVLRHIVYCLGYKLIGVGQLVVIDRIEWVLKYNLLVFDVALNVYFKAIVLHLRAIHDSVEIIWHLGSLLLKVFIIFWKSISLVVMRFLILIHINRFI